MSPEPVAMILQAFRKGGRESLPCARLAVTRHTSFREADGIERGNVLRSA
jgi:hypothetical protein